MKRMVFTLVAMAVFATMNAQEGEVKHSVIDDFHLEFKMQSGFRQHGMTPLNADLQLSYEFVKRWSLLVTAEGGRMLYDDSRTYIRNTSLGGGLTYVWVDEGCQRFDLRLQVLNTIGNPDWRQTTFDIGATWYRKPEKRALVPVIGFGFRYQKSHTAEVQNWTGVYASIGLRL